MIVGQGTEISSRRLALFFLSPPKSTGGRKIRNSQKPRQRVLPAALRDDLYVASILRRPGSEPSERAQDLVTSIQSMVGRSAVVKRRYFCSSSSSLIISYS